VQLLKLNKMAFLIFEKANIHGKMFYKNLNEPFKLGGNGLINKLWESKGRPLNQGYSLSASELLSQHNRKFSGETHSLVIDFDPGSQKIIGLVEIENIHLYTFGDEGIANWTPMMLELREVYYDDITEDEKEKILIQFEVQANRQQIVEFLYLKGDENSWNWGRNGGTNASFLHDAPRKYFRKFF
jgi:hypothetical protein